MKKNFMKTLLIFLCILSVETYAAFWDIKEVYRGERYILAERGNLYYTSGEEYGRYSVDSNGNLLEYPKRNESITLELKPWDKIYKAFITINPIAESTKCLGNNTIDFQFITKSRNLYYMRFIYWYYGDIRAILGMRYSGGYSYEIEIKQSLATETYEEIVIRMIRQNQDDIKELQAAGEETYNIIGEILKRQGVI